MVGKLIIVEGGDGAGKSTLVKNLHDALTSEGVAATLTREPGGSELAEEVRSILLAKRKGGEMFSPSAQLLLFYAARAEHLDKLVRPALERGEIVLCDRFELSTYAYQVHAQDGSHHTLFDPLHQHVAEVLAPYECTYLICDIDPEEGQRRIAERNEETTNYDDLDLTFHHRVREGLHAARDRINTHFTCLEIDARKSPEEMLAEARKKLGV